MVVHKQKNSVPRRNATLADVARIAGVSTASVSRALNSPQLVSGELRQRIEKTINELGYIPSGAARALATRHTRAIGAVIPTLDNAIFATGISAFQRRLAQSGYTLLVAATEYNLDNELEEVRTLLAQGVEGLMLIGSAHRAELYECLSRSRVAYVCCWMYDAASPHPCIGFDNRESARKLTELLLDLGHQDIAMIAGITQDNDRATDRLAGVQQALSTRGLQLWPERLVEAPYDIAAGRDAFRTLQNAHSDWPTAIICGNDVLAIGALLECHAQQIRVPETLSIVGFDDLPIAAHFHPPLTTVRVPSTEMGRLAGDYLLARLNDRRIQNHLNVPTSVIVRNTSGPPRPA